MKHMWPRQRIRTKSSSKRGRVDFLASYQKKTSRGGEGDREVEGGGGEGEDNTQREKEQ